MSEAAAHARPSAVILAIQENLVPGESVGDRLAFALDAGFDGLELRDAARPWLEAVRGRAPTSCPALTIISISRGKVSRLWPGMKNEVLRSYFRNNLSRRGTPTSVAKMPRWMSEGLSPPP